MRLNTKLSSAGLLSTVIVFLVLLSGCAPTVKVRSDSAPDVNLSSFETYDFFSQLGVEGSEYSSLLGQHFREAVSGELGARGYQRSNSPELQVNVSIGAKEKVRVNTYNDPYLYGGHYGYRRYGYYGSPWYTGGTRTTVRQYTEANVYIDLVDVSQHRLVWQGVATFNVTDKMRQNLRETVQSTVASVFEKYPVPAGSR